MGRLFTGTVILVLGGGVAATVVVQDSRLLRPYLSGHGDHFPRDTAKMQMRMFEAALDMYYGAHKRLPFSLQDLATPSCEEPEPYLQKIPRDPWGNAFAYRPAERGRFTLHSWGEDGRPGTVDDLVWPEPQEEPLRGAAPSPARGPGPGGR